MCLIKKSIIKKGNKKWLRGDLELCRKSYKRKCRTGFSKKVNEKKNSRQNSILFKIDKEFEIQMSDFRIAKRIDDYLLSPSSLAISYNK